jgi:hypothetical protein
MNRKRRDVTQSYKLQFSIEDMRRFGGEAWGQIGADIVDRWCEFNAAYFGGVLKPVPLVISNTQPFGKRIAFCSYDPDASGRTITLNVPARHHVLVADNNTLLHDNWRAICPAESHRALAARWLWNQLWKARM